MVTRLTGYAGSCQEKKFLTMVGDSSRSQKTKVGTADKDAFNQSIRAGLLFWLLFLVERSAHGLIDVFRIDQAVGR
jgi:hypothetical protein